MIGAKPGVSIVQCLVTSAFGDIFYLKSVNSLLEMTNDPDEGTRMFLSR